MEARIVGFEGQSWIRVHYKGFAAKFDESIETESDRIAEVGSFSQAFGWARYHSQYNRPMRVRHLRQEEEARVKRKQMEEPDQRRQEELRVLWKGREERFRRKLQDKELLIKDMEGDGNCLFRAVADQVYGRQQLHRLIRQKCMDYLEANQAYFQAFVSEENFGEYVQRKRQEGVWGDDVELQAISEIYNRPIEIYAYAAEPMRTFHEQKEALLLPIRLSYFGQNHYDSIVPVEESKFRASLCVAEPGVVEDQAIQL